MPEGKCGKQKESDEEAKETVMRSKATESLGEDRQSAGKDILKYVPF